MNQVTFKYVSTSIYAIAVQARHVNQIRAYTFHVI